MLAALIASVVGQTGGGGANGPIPLGWYAVGGALSLTFFTILALRRLSRWSITDLEDALARSRVEVRLGRDELDLERAVIDRLRAQCAEKDETIRLLTVANQTLQQENIALQAEVHRLETGSADALD